jgi:hypothetical protein
MDLVKDDSGKMGEDRSAPFRTDKEIQAFGSGDEDFWRVMKHLTAIRLRGIPAPCQDTDIRKILPCLFENCSQFIEWTEQVTLNVVVESS